MPLLKTLFEKDIFRYIETVIKADDSEHLIDEMTEYVLTTDVAGKAAALFENYSETGFGGAVTEGPNGCWISGFFGSGKSHLLKMISYTLENREIKGQKLGELFLKKVEEHRDPKLAADVQKSLRIPSESILFNIDQKSDAIGAHSKGSDAILSVFYKVFNEHCGYSTAHFLAGIERHLHKTGKYGEFKAAYKKKFNQTWAECRDGLHLIAQDFAEAYAEVSGMTIERALELFDKYDTQFKLSIEDFAQDVNDYIETKPAGFRLNFFVDEVGQYIGNDSKLMLNLQTIVETLATRTNRRAWVFVTSQSDLTTSIGDVTGQQQQDYSKINARFSIKIPLTSRNAEEVIRKRLLQKNNEGINYYSSLYNKEKNNLATIFHFREGIKYKNFHDEEQFVHLAPFIPYQSDLFQQCIKGLSEHNCFQGKHQSFGERSMLGVFQMAARDLAENDGGTWATFDKFYDGIEGTLRPEVIQLISVAKTHLDKDLEKSLLKVLFLVKYTTTFKATSQNLSVLMVPTLNTDLESHEKALQEALNLLENQTYIKRSSDGYYEFLTSEEKDIQTEINQEPVSHPEITRWIADYIFKEILGGYKITSKANGQPYEYYRRIDGVADTAEKILCINLITRFHEFYEDLPRLFAMNMSARELMIRLDNAPFDLTREVAVYLKTDRYTKQQHNVTESRKLILDGIRLQHNEHGKLLQQKIETLLASATLILNGSIVNVQSSNGKVRIQDAFQYLIGAVYTDLKMLPASSYSDEQVRRLLALPPDSIITATAPNTAENEVLTKIKRRDNEGQRVSLADCIREFQQPPYGWYIAATLYQIASLIQKGLFEIELDKTKLTAKELSNVILNSQKQNSCIIRLKESYSEKDLNALSKLYITLFDENITGNSPTEYAENFRIRLKTEVQTLKALYEEFKMLPAAQCIVDTFTLFEKYTEREETFYLREIVKKEDDFADVREKSKRITTILLNGNQKAILARALELTDRSRNANFDFLPAEKKEKLKTMCMGKRIDDIPSIKALCDELDEFERKQLYSVRTEAASAVKEVETFFNGEPSFTLLSDNEKKTVFSPLIAIEKAIEEDCVIANIIHHKNAIKECYSKINNQIANLEKQQNSPAIQSPVNTGSNSKSENATVPIIAPKPIVSSTAIHVKKMVPVIDSLEQLDEYLTAVKSAWSEVIRGGGRISL